MWFKRRRAGWKICGGGVTGGQDHCAGDEQPIEVGKSTLFVNAAIQGAKDGTQFPWVVDIELPAAVALEGC